MFNLSCTALLSDLQKDGWLAYDFLSLVMYYFPLKTLPLYIYHYSHDNSSFTLFMQLVIWGHILTCGKYSTFIKYRMPPCPEAFPSSLLQMLILCLQVLWRWVCLSFTSWLCSPFLYVVLPAGEIRGRNMKPHPC